MSVHTTFKTGGRADYYAVPKTVAEAVELIRFFNKRRIPWMVIGNGSNLLVSDEGYRGAIIDLGSHDGSEFSLMGYEWIGDVCSMDVGAGCRVTAVGNIAAGIGASGMEGMTAIPGCVGGACVMNAGAFGQEMKDIVVRVKVIDRSGRVSVINKDELDYGYRRSALMDRSLVVCRAELNLKRSTPGEVRARCAELARMRGEKQPLEYPSAGSTFKRPEGYFAGRLISDAGLKGYSIGGAKVSEKHAGFIINTGNATSREIYALIRYVQDEVERKSGVRLIPEVRMVGEF